MLYLQLIATCVCANFKFILTKFINVFSGKKLLCFRMTVKSSF